ncbi:MAG TPA: BREX-1 system phosphatase PglZ type B, partial [Anaerolineaceae bacterium]|nr:BREX-1 system phosphatase PglZ type B [Anaerolineaceae bacterium]
MPEKNNTFLDALVAAIQQAGIYDKNDLTPPAAVLWTDKERQWEGLIPALRPRLPLLTLGAYDPAKRSGPSYWIRCMIARILSEDVLPAEAVPIIYLPGVSRSDIRAIEECPPSLQPLAELQYRGVVWSQKNGHDWTISAFLQTKSGGLGLEVSGDQATKDALKRALLKLADESVDRLQKEVPLKAAFFDALLNPDEARSLLLWLNDPAGYRLKVNLEEWQAFCNVCKAKYKFHPELDGTISAAQLLGSREGNWKQVWDRFKESPRAYPNLPDLLRQSRPPQPELFDSSESWPQDNETAEEQLQQQLIALANFPFQDARASIIDLEERHGQRRAWVWAALGQSPLAQTLEPLSTLAKLSEKALVGSTVQEIAQAYLDWGWQVDEAALDALTLIQSPGISMGDINAIKGAVRALYQLWLEGAAANLQKAIAAGPTALTYPFVSLKKPEKGTCILFSDALRLDVGKKLAAALESADYQIQTETHLAALPAITSTAKFAFAPDPGKITGIGSKSFTPMLSGKETPITAEAFRKILEEEGFQILRGEDLGDPSGLAWTEMGEIDAYGHEHGCKLAIHLLGELLALRNRIENLLDFGWKKVVTVTDHGWLLLPGGLPKTYIPEHLTDLRKGRCARLKEGAHIDQQIVPWYWDKDVRVAIAPNICCYEAGKEYEHGGISPQECITPMFTITKAAIEPNLPVSFESLKWRGLRLAAKI